eukprot:NODE_42_length_29671_cov_0.584810.p5 type:complete len:313 gc:universal NODE_42_length_29671_cov_0.584810:9396-10334(+)
MSSISNDTYTFTNIQGASGYLMFKAPFVISNVSCTNLSYEYDGNIKSCYGTSKNAAELVPQYCTERCHSALTEVSRCINDKKESDASIILRYWFSHCLASPKNSSNICLVSRLNLLTEKGGDESVLKTTAAWPMTCDACTRVSMARMLDDYEFLKNNPIYAASLPDLSNIQISQENVIRECGNTYDQLEIDPSDTGSRSSLPTYGIVLIVVGCVAALLLLGLCVRRRCLKSRQGNAENDSCIPKDPYQMNESGFSPKHKQEDADDSVGPSDETLGNERYSFPQPRINASANIASNEENVYDDMRVTNFRNLN